MQTSDIDVLDAVKSLGAQVKTLAATVADTQALHTKSLTSTASYADDIKKANAAGEAQMQHYQDLKLKVDSVEKTQQWVEKQLSRGSNNGGRPNGSHGDGVIIDNISKDMNDKVNFEIGEYLTKGARISTESDQYLAKAVVGCMPLSMADDMRSIQTKSLAVGSDPKGGYWITPELLSKTIQRIFETSPIRSIASIENTSTDAVNMIIDDTEASSGGWVGEVQIRVDTNTPTIGEQTIVIHSQYAMPKVTSKMLEDAGFDVQAYLNRKIARKLSRVENTAFVVGDGSQKPRGFLTYPNWDTAGVYQRGAIEQIASGVSGEFTADGIKVLQNSVVEDYQPNAIFGLKRASWSAISTLQDTIGQYYLGIDTLKTGDTPVLYGKPVIFMNDMPDVAADALAIVYGDFSVGYTIIDRLGIRIIRDELTDKPYIKYYTEKRVGGDVTNYQSLKIQKLSVSI